MVSPPYPIPQADPPLAPQGHLPTMYERLRELGVDPDEV